MRHHLQAKRAYRWLAVWRFSTGTAGQVHRIAQFIVTPFAAAEGEELVDRRQRQNVFPVNRIQLSDVIGQCCRGFVFTSFRRRI